MKTISRENCKAEPMRRTGVPGYAVKYPDGYVSWSSKETFEKAYRTGLPGISSTSRVGGKGAMIRRVVGSFIAEKEQDRV